MYQNRPFKTQLLKLIFVITTCVISACGNSHQPEKKTETKTLIDSNSKEISAEIEKDPQNAELYYRRAMIYFNQKYLARALTDVADAIRLDSVNPLYYYQRGRIQYSMNKTIDASVSYEKSIALKKDYEEAKMKLAELYYIVKKHSESLALLNDVLSNHPEKTDAHFFKGMNFKEMGDTLKSIAAFQHALETDANNFDAAIQLGTLYAARKQKPAFDYFSSAIRMQKRNPQGWLGRGYYLQSIGKYQAALFDYRKVIELDPSNDQAYYYVGYINYEVKQYKEALRAWSICIRINNRNLDAYYMRGLVNELTGNKSEAKLNYEYVVQMDPNYALAKERLMMIRK